MKRLFKRCIVIVSFILAFTLVAPAPLQNTFAIQTVDAATAQLNKTELKLRVGKSKKLKVTGTTKKIKWSSSKNSVAKVDKNGTVTGKKKAQQLLQPKSGRKN